MKACKSSTLALRLQGFFSDYLPRQRALSPHTLLCCVPESISARSPTGSATLASTPRTNTSPSIWKPNERHSPDRAACKSFRTAGLHCYTW
jgi:hypothetical protein